MSATIEKGVGSEGIRNDTVFGRIGGALRERDFRWWFAGQVTSASGVMAQGVAVSWWMLQTTGDAVWLSVLTLFTWGPTLVGGAWAGAVVDRSDRRRLLFGTQSVLMAVAATLTVLAATGSSRVERPGRLGGLGRDHGDRLPGAAGVRRGPGRGGRRRQRGRAVGSGAERFAGGGAGLGRGFARRAGRRHGVLRCERGSYLAPLIVLLKMKARTEGAHAAVRKRVRGAARDGIRYAFRSPIMRALLPMSAASGLIFGMGVALPPLVQRALHQGGGGYGAMMAAFGIGGLPGALLAAAQPEPTGRRVRWLALATAAR